MSLFKTCTCPILYVFKTKVDIIYLQEIGDRVYKKSAISTFILICCFLKVCSVRYNARKESLIYTCVHTVTYNLS